MSKSTRTSISEPANLDKVRDVVANIKVSLSGNIIKRYLPWLSTIPLNQGMSWDPTWKALPTYQVFHFPTAGITSEIQKVTGKKNVRTSFLALK